METIIIKVCDIISVIAAIVWAFSGCSLDGGMWQLMLIINLISVLIGIAAQEAERYILAYMEYIEDMEGEYTDYIA